MKIVSKILCKAAKDKFLGLVLNIKRFMLSEGVE